MKSSVGQRKAEKGGVGAAITGRPPVLFLFRVFDVVQRCLIRMGMLAHEREDEPFFFSTPIVYKNSQIKTVVKATVFEIFRKKESRAEGRQDVADERIRPALF